MVRPAAVLLGFFLLASVGAYHAVRADDEAAEVSGPQALQLCALATNCSSCLSNYNCGWCGDSDSSGQCLYCPNGGNCGCSSAFTNILCPSASDEIALSVLAITGIVVASVVGFCCLVGIIGVGLFCLCVRRTNHTNYVVAGAPITSHVQHHYNTTPVHQPLPHQPPQYYQHHQEEGKPYINV